MTRRLRWTRRATRRLDEIGDYVARDDFAAAARVIATFESAVQNLVSHPAMGRTGRITGTRELILTDIPYIVAYRVTHEAVEILTIVHTSQRWPDDL